MLTYPNLTARNKAEWIRQQKDYVEYCFGITSQQYSIVDNVVIWNFENKEIAKHMATVWTLKDEGYRCSYQSKIRTFFWIDTDFYRQNKEDILQWAYSNNCKVPSEQHGWIEMPDDDTAFMFRMTWAGKVYR